MKPYYIPVDKLVGVALRAVAERKYLLMRESDGSLVGCNPALVNMPKVRKDYGKLSKYVSWRLVDFNTYVSYKVPFIKPMK